MKKHTITLLIVLLISSLAIAQKNELKSADKALKKGDLTTAKASLESAASLIAQCRY